MPIPVIVKAIKAVGKFLGRQVLRRTGVFGTYGSVKRLWKEGYRGKDLIKKLSGSILKKNVLKQLGPLNYLIDLKKGGIVYTLKQIGYQNLTPMAIKKGYYLYQNFKSIVGKTKADKVVAKTENEMFWEKLSTTSKRSYAWKLNKIELIYNDDTMDKKYKKEMLNGWFYFIPKSTSHNFDCDYYRWNPWTGELWACVKSSKGEVKYYKANNVQLWLIKKSLSTTRYGKMVYWKFYHK